MRVSSRNKSHELANARVPNAQEPNALAKLNMVTQDLSSN